MVRDGKPKGVLLSGPPDGGWAAGHYHDTHTTPASVHDSIPYLGRLER